MLSYKVDVAFKPKIQNVHLKFNAWWRPKCPIECVTDLD